MVTLVDPVAKHPATVKETNMLILISLSDNRGLDKQWRHSVKIAKECGVKRTPNELEA